MDKNHFMQILYSELKPMNQNEINDIMSDFEEHFASGLANNKSEDEIVSELGNPYEIASQFKDGSYEGAPPVQNTAVPAAPASQATQPQPPKNKINEGALVGVILLNIFLGIPIWISLFSTLFGFWVTAGGIGISAAVLFVVAIVQAGYVSIILALFGLALTALTILAVILMVYLTKWLCMGLVAYVRWNKKLVMGGSPA